MPTPFSPQRERLDAIHRESALLKTRFDGVREELHILRANGYRDAARGELLAEMRAPPKWLPSSARERASCAKCTRRAGRILANDAILRTLR